MISIENISADTAETLCRQLTNLLPEYFGLPKANEHYALGVRLKTNFAAKMKEDYIGLISLNFPYENNGNIYWMAIHPKFHNLGIGSKLIQRAVTFAYQQGAITLTVETLAPSESDKNYLKTYYFYLKQSFSPLFNLKPQGHEGNMVYMVKTVEMANLNNLISS